MELLRLVKSGEDPMKAKRAYNAAITVDQLIEAYLYEGGISKPDKREFSWRGGYDHSLDRRHARLISMRSS